MRNLKYRDALSEGLVQAMEADPSIFVTGISVNYSSHVFGTTKKAADRFPDRVITAPAMENALTGICIGAAAMGKRPVIVHDRADFSFLAMDQLINLAAKWKYMYGGNAGSVPVVTRMIVGRGWGQGATHSQSLHSLYGHFPGLNVVTPSSAGAAKQFLQSALTWDAPTVILEHRSLFEIEDDVFPDYCPLAWDAGGYAGIANYTSGSDILIVGTSAAAADARHASDILSRDFAISAPVLDIATIRPFPGKSLETFLPTCGGRLLAVDGAHELFGVASEVCAYAAEHAFASLKTPPRRLTLPDCPAPVAKSLEDAFYPTASTIVRVVLDMLGRDIPEGLAAIDRADSFKGPY